MNAMLDPPLPWSLVVGVNELRVADSLGCTVCLIPNPTQSDLANIIFLLSSANAFPKLVAALQEIDDLVLDECDLAPSIARDALKTAGVTE